jgi:hypothetical protein
MMLKRIMLVLSLAAALNPTGLPAQTPVYKLLYSAPEPSSQGAAPVTIFEAAPGLFYFLSAQGGPNLGFGPSIFSLTGEGPPKLLYSLPTTFIITEDLVQGADSRLYGAVFDSSRQGLYYSISAAGKGFQQYSAGQWNSMWMLTATPGGLYDGVGSQEAYALARIDENGKFAVIRTLSTGEGVPVGGLKLVPASDGNLYGVGNQSIELSPPFFIYRLAPSGVYSQILTLHPGPDGGLGWQPLRHV